MTGRCGGAGGVQHGPQGGMRVPLREASARRERLQACFEQSRHERGGAAWIQAPQEGVGWTAKG